MGAHKDLDFQGRSTESGSAFTIQCNLHLKTLGFKLLGRKVIRDAGVEVDQVAVNSKGRKIYFEFKGGYEGDRPGLIRTDTTKKMLCNAFLLHFCGLRPFIVITSAKATNDRCRSARMITRAAQEIPDVIFDIVELGDAGDRKRLKELLDMDDFSRPRLPRPVAKVSKADTTGMPPRPLEDAFQISSHPDLKVLDSRDKKRRKVLTDKKTSKVQVKKKRKRDQETIPLFDEE